MKDCNHSNVSILEEYVCWSDHDFKDGKLIDHNSDETTGTHTGVIIARCLDCGKSHHFSKRQKRPAWVQVLESQIGATETE